MSELGAPARSKAAILTARPALTRSRGPSLFAPASGVRRVHRRFRAHGRPANHRTTIARPKTVLKPPQSRTLARWREGQRTSRSVWSAARSPPLSRPRGSCELTNNHRPCKSGAEAIAVQTLARWREGQRTSRQRLVCGAFTAALALARAIAVRASVRGAPAIRCACA